MISEALRRLKRRLRARFSRQHQQTRRGQALTRRLRKTLDRHLKETDVRGLQFYVKNGRVTLYGTVRRASERALVVHLVRQVPGVQAVVANNVQVVASHFRNTERSVSPSA